MPVWLMYAIFLSSYAFTYILSLQVRLGEVLEDGQVHTKRLGSHRGAVHKLAVEPGNPNILYSYGDDSFIQHVHSFFFFSLYMLLADAPVLELIF